MARFWIFGLLLLLAAAMMTGADLFDSEEPTLIPSRQTENGDRIRTIINGKVRCPPGTVSDLNGRCKEIV
ncbi:Hypothetical protein NTJ_14511 [Nesidiocoris tenuis]|uniref:Uncharacterized protein n=1 Tax=Nesidiocoris tenuis TaxID=355587 RepID=A0ABN7BBC7_9HEMI|nr:Hypothetical protein NTJ_14511 [Nesidiocoris tenuis]